MIFFVFLLFSDLSHCKDPEPKGTEVNNRQLEQFLKKVQKIFLSDESLTKADKNKIENKSFFQSEIVLQLEKVYCFFSKEDIGIIYDLLNEYVDLGEKSNQYFDHLINLNDEFKDKYIILKKMFSDQFLSFFNHVIFFVEEDKNEIEEYFYKEINKFYFFNMLFEDEESISRKKVFYSFQNFYNEYYVKNFYGREEIKIEKIEDYLKHIVNTDVKYQTNISLFFEEIFNLFSYNENEFDSNDLFFDGNQKIRMKLFVDEIEIAHSMIKKYIFSEDFLKLINFSLKNNRASTMQLFKKFYEFYKIHEIDNELMCLSQELEKIEMMDKYQVNIFYNLMNDILLEVFLLMENNYREDKIMDDLNLSELGILRSYIFRYKKIQKNKFEITDFLSHIIKCLKYYLVQDLNEEKLLEKIDISFLNQ